MVVHVVDVVVDMVVDVVVEVTERKWRESPRALLTVQHSAWPLNCYHTYKDETIK